MVVGLPLVLHYFQDPAVSKFTTMRLNLFEFEV